MAAVFSYVRRKPIRALVWAWDAFWIILFLIVLAWDPKQVGEALSGLLTFVAIGEVPYWIGRLIQFTFNEQKARAAQRQAQLIAQQQHDEAEREAILHAPLSPIDVTGIALQKGEQCYLEQQVIVAAPHTTTRRVGGYGGVSVPTPIKGVRMRLGQFASNPVSSTQFQVEGPGTAWVTNQRIIINGQFGNRTFTLKSIVGTEPYLDGIRLDIANKKPIVLQSGDIRLAATIAKVLDANRATSG